MIHKTFVNFIFFILFSLTLHAQNNLDKVYYITGENITISSIVKNTTKDVILFQFSANRYTKRVRSKELLNLLKANGYKDYIAQSRYIKFIKKSPIDSSKIEQFVINFYKNSYKEIEIKKLTLLPRGYVKHLPKEYTITIPPKNFLSNSGTLYVKTDENKKIFFNYEIDADIFVYKAKQYITRGSELSLINTIKKRVRLDRFRATPLQEIKKQSLQSKHHMKVGKLITVRDVQAINLVKRNDLVSVSLHKDSMEIDFSAKALQNGKLNDIITVKNNNDKKFKVIVIGKNKVEIK